MTDSYRIWEQIGLFKDIPESRREFACKCLDDLYQIWELNPDMDYEISSFTACLGGIISRTTSEFESVFIYQKYLEFKDHPNTKAFILENLPYGYIDVECEVMHMFRESIVDELNGVNKNNI